MKTKLIAALWGILSLSVAGLALPACGGGMEPAVVAPQPADPEPQPDNIPDNTEDPAPQPEAEVDCVAEGFCETGHACEANAQCASDRCELTIGICIESCSAGFTFWTANGNEMGTCIPTPLPPPPAEAWM